MPQTYPACLRAQLWGDPEDALVIVIVPLRSSDCAERTLEAVPDVHIGLDTGLGLPGYSRALGNSAPFSRANSRRQRP